MTDQAPPSAAASAPVPGPWPDLAGAPATPASLCALAAVDADRLTGTDLVDAVVCAEKAISLLIGVQARLLAALAVPFVAGDPMRLAARLARRSGLADGADAEENVQAMVSEAAQSLAAGEIAAALRIAPVTAGIRVRDAVGLAEEFTPARQALEDGILDRGKLRAIVDQVQVLPAEQIGPVLEQVLPAVVDRCTSEVREIAAQAVITADPDGAADRHRQAADRRELTLTPGSDAMATLKAFLPADGAVKIFQISDLLATGTAGIPGDGRGIGARRVDALVDLADRLLSDGHIDLTGFIGRPLPDPTDPHHRPRRASHTNSTGCTGTDTDRTGTGRRTDTDRTGDTAPTPAAGLDPPAAPASARVVTCGHAGTESPNNNGSHGAAPAIEHAEAAEGPNQSCTPTDPGGDRPAGDASTTPTGGPVLTRQGRRPHLTITLSLDTLAGLNDLPAVLAGYGSIPADLARSIATSAGTITAALTDPTTGAITRTGELTYRPRQALRDQSAARTDTCQFPSCRQPAWRCDLDHRDRFHHHHPDQGGPTTVDNCAALCRRHHLFKDHADWQLTVDTSQLIINWTSPTGHTYTRRPRQTAPPGTWIRTTGTTIAQRLDELAALHTFHTHTGPTTNTDIPDTGTGIPDTGNGKAGTGTASACTGAGGAAPAGTGTLEDRLTDAMLRHALSQPRRIEYDPTPGRQSVDHPTSTTEPTTPNGNESDADPNPEVDDPPPF